MPSNLEAVARAITYRAVLAIEPRVTGARMVELIDRHWRVAAELLEAGVIDETGADARPPDTCIRR